MEAFWEILKSIVQGIVQGITEWLPISSTGHIILLNEFWPMDQDFFNLFKVLIQLGSILAVLVLYFHKLNPFSPKKTDIQRKDTWHLWWKVLIASIPAGVIGVLFNDIIDEKLSTSIMIAATLIIYGVLFLIVENMNKQPRIRSFDEMDYKTVLLIGVFQMLALIPGTSRSGATIVGALMLGCSRYVAAEFSFFMAISVMFGASAIKLLKYFSDGLTLSGLEWGMLLTGMLVSFVVSMVVIKFLMSFIKKHDFKPFGYYRIALGLLLLVLFFTGLMPQHVVS